MARSGVVRYDESGKIQRETAQRRIRSVALYSDSGLVFHIRRRKADELVAIGKAIPFEDDLGMAIRWAKPTVVVRSSDLLWSEGQGITYKLAAADSNRSVFQGGLQRTEHRPGKIDKFTAARVGPY